MMHEKHFWKKNRTFITISMWLCSLGLAVLVFILVVLSLIQWHEGMSQTILGGTVIATLLAAILFGYLIVHVSGPIRRLETVLLDMYEDIPDEHREYSEETVELDRMLKRL